MIVEYVRHKNEDKLGCCVLPVEVEDNFLFKNLFPGVVSLR